MCVCVCGHACRYIIHILPSVCIIRVTAYIYMSICVHMVACVQLDLSVWLCECMYSGPCLNGCVCVSLFLSLYASSLMNISSPVNEGCRNYEWKHRRSRNTDEEHEPIIRKLLGIIKSREGIPRDVAVEASGLPHKGHIAIAKLG